MAGSLSGASPPPMNTFQWLLVLGFPPSVAATTVSPETFLPENASDSIAGAKAHRGADTR